MLDGLYEYLHAGCIKGTDGAEAEAVIDESLLRFSRRDDKLVQSQLRSRVSFPKFWVEALFPRPTCIELHVAMSGIIPHVLLTRDDGSCSASLYACRLRRRLHAVVQYPDARRRLYQHALSLRCQTGRKATTPDFFRSNVPDAYLRQMQPSPTA